MADIQSTLRYDADLGSAMAQVKTLTGQINTLNLAFNSLDASAQKTKMSMANAFSSNVGSMGAYTSKIVQMKSAAESFGEAIQKNRLTMSQYFKEAAVGLVKQDSLLKQYARQQVRYQQSISMSMGTGVGGKPMAMVLTPKALDMANAATRMKVLNQEFNTFRTLVNQGATELINFGKNTQWTGRQLTVGLTMPVVLFGAAFAKTFMKIDKELTRFAKVYGQDLVANNAAATEKMKQQVMDLAKTISSTMGVAASETAALAADVAATGKTGQDLLDTVAQTTRLAVLGEVDRQEAMKATLAIQTAFKQNTTELADSINFLNAVENQTSTTLNDLVEAIPKAGPVIKGLGGDIKDLSVLMVAMKEGGIPAAEAANAIKSGMASLINPTKKAADTAKEFGVNIEGIVKANKGQLMPTIFALQGALNGLDDFSKSRVIEEIFGKYQFARISALFNNLGKAGSQTQEAMKLAGASTVELAAVASRELRTYTESTTVRFQRMVETIKNQLVPIGQALLDGLMPILNAASGIIDTVGRFFEKIPDQGKGFLKFVGAIALLAGPALMLIGLFKQLIGNGVKAAMSIVTLGARLAGIKVGPLQHLDAEAAAAQAQVQNLTTSFVSQSEAVGMLNAEMQLYLQGLRRLAGTSPQMFTPPIGGRASGRPPIKRAGGGDVPGGYGGGDKVPALLESGEFVVKKEAASKYRPILDAMNSGAIKGFQHGTQGDGHISDLTPEMQQMYGARFAGPTARAHGTPSVDVPIASILALEGVSQSVAGGLRQMQAEGHLVTKAFSNLIFNLARDTNAELDLNGTNRRMLIEEIGLRKTWNDTMKITGSSFAELKPIISALQTEMGALNAELIDDPEFYATVEKVVRRFSAAGDVAAQKLEYLSKQFGTVKMNTAGQRGAINSNISPSYKSPTFFGSSRSFFGPERPSLTISPSSIAGQSVLVPQDPFGAGMSPVSTGLDQGLADSTRARSDSQETLAIGRKYGTYAGNGLINGLKEGMAKSMAALDRIRMQMANMAPMPNSGPSDPYTPLAPGARGAALMMEEARRQGIPGSKPSPIFLGMPTMPTGPAMPDAEQASRRGSLAQGLMNKSGAMMNIGFMGSMVAGMMSMNGEVNAATTALTALTTATMAAGGAMQMMSMFSGGGGKGFMGLKGLGGAMESKGASMIAAGGARAGVGSLLANLGPKVAMAGGPYGIAAAAAVTALVGGFILYKKAASEARERANAAFAEPAKLAEYFGKTLKDVNSTLKDISVSGASDEIGAIDQGLRDVVSQDYATLIEKLKTSITSIGAADLGNAYTQMIIEGMSAEEATAAIKAVASEAGTAGGLAFDQAMGKSLLSSKNVEEAFGQRMAAIDPNSQYNQKRTAELMAQRADIQANPAGMTRYGKGYTSEQMDQLGSINESLNVSGEVFSSTLKDAIKLSQSSPEIVAKYAKDIAESFKQLNASSMSFAGLGQSEQEVAFDQFKNMMGELNDPAINKAVDSLQRATPEIQGLAMEVVALGIPLTEATDKSGRFNETLAQGAIDSRREIIRLNEEIKNLNTEFNDNGGRNMRVTLDAAQKAYDALLTKRQEFDQRTKYHIGEINQGLNQQRKASESAVEGMQSEIDVLDEKIKVREEENDLVVKNLEKEKEQIQETTDKYLSSIQKRQQADTFYANQRKSNIGALGKLASGDVFGFLQDRQAIAQEADSFGYDQQIKSIEERRDAEVSSIDKTIEKKNEQTDKFVNGQQKQIDMVQKQIDAEQKAMDQREENAQKTIRQYEKIRKVHSDKLDDQITKQNSAIGEMKNINEGMKDGQIQSYADVTTAYGKSIGEQYKIFAQDLIRKTFERMKEEKKSKLELQSYLGSRYAELFPNLSNVMQGMNSDQIAKELGLSFGNTTEASTYDVSGTRAMRAAGGYISGPGGPTEDKIPAMLSNGEYVIRASSVEKYGPDFMDSINMGYYAEGGLIEQRRGAGGSGGSNARFVSQLQLLKDSKRNPKNKPTNTIGTNTDGEAAVNYAKQQFGDPYDMNPNPPNSWGCSVLTAWAYNRGTKNGQNRYNFETYSESQANTISGKIMRPSGSPGDGSAPQIPYNRFKVGDLVYFSNTGMGPSGRHIGLYSGNGQMVHAGNPVGYSDLNSDWNRKYFTYGGTPKPKFAKGGIVGNAKAGMFGMGGMAKSMPRYAVGGNIVMPSSPPTNISAPTYNIAINANGIQDPAYFANKVIGIIKKEQKRVDHSRSVFS